MLSENGLFKVRNLKLCIKNADTPKTLVFMQAPSLTFDVS